MTTIIGALCENKSSIVFVADRMITAQDGTITFECEPKNKILSSNAMVLSSGTINEPEIINKAKSEIAGRMKVNQMVEILSKHYVATRMKKIETDILSKYGFLSFEAYYNKQQMLAESTVNSIQTELDNYDLELNIIFGGVDNNNYGHLCLVSDPGTYISFDNVGFCCSGIGKTHTDAVFAFYEYKPTMSKVEALYIAYMAKKRSQLAIGVGNETDAWILDISGCCKVFPETLSQLDTYRIKNELSDLHGSIDLKLDVPELPSDEDD